MDAPDLPDPTTAAALPAAAPVAGVAAQPAVSARARVLIRQLGGSVVVALVGVACTAMASHTLLRLGDTSRLWPMLMNLASILVAVACLLQWHAWRQADKEWSGQRDVSLLGLLVPCRIAAAVALVAAVVGPLGCVEVFRQTAATEAAHWWSLAAAACTILAAGFGGIHALDPAGPRGARHLPLVELPHHAHGVAGGEVLDEDTLVLQRRRALAGRGLGEPEAEQG